MMWHMVIGGCKRGVIRMDLIIGALLLLFNFSFFLGILKKNSYVDKWFEYYFRALCYVWVCDCVDKKCDFKSNCIKWIVWDCILKNIYIYIYIYIWFENEENMHFKKADIGVLFENAWL